MIQIDSKHPAGAVSYITANHPRYQKFYDSLERLNVPTGTILVHETNYNAAHNRNVCIAGMQGDWILFIDDDQVFESDSLMQLLDKNVDIVSGIYPRRMPPFAPCAYSDYDPERKKHKSFSWAELSNESGLLPVRAVGAGFLLVKRTVIEAMQKPYFRVGLFNGPEWEGTSQDMIQEDIGFCLRAANAGFAINLDLGTSIGHVTEVTVCGSRQSHGAFSVFAEIGDFATWLFKGEFERKLKLII